MDDNTSLLRIVLCIFTWEKYLLRRVQRYSHYLGEKIYKLLDVIITKDQACSLWHKFKLLRLCWIQIKAYHHIMWSFMMNPSLSIKSTWRITSLFIHNCLYLISFLNLLGVDKFNQNFYSRSGLIPLIVFLLIVKSAGIHTVPKLTNLMNDLLLFISFYFITSLSTMILYERFLSLIK